MVEFSTHSGQLEKKGVQVYEGKGHRADHRAPSRGERRSLPGLHRLQLIGSAGHAQCLESLDLRHWAVT